VAKTKRPNTFNQKAVANGLTISNFKSISLPPIFISKALKREFLPKVQPI